MDYLYTVEYPLDLIENGQLEVSLNIAALTGYIMCERLGLAEIEANVSFFREGTDEERCFTQKLKHEDQRNIFEYFIALFTPFAKILLCVSKMLRRTLQTQFA